MLFRSAYAVHVGVADGSFGNGCFSSNDLVRVTSKTLTRDFSVTGANDDGIGVIDNVTFGSPAAEAGFDWDQTVEVVRKPTEQPSKYWMFIPALILLAFVVVLQRGRAARSQPAAA